MLIRSIAAVTAALGVLVAGAFAGVPTYSGFQLQARANFAGAFNLPNSTFFTNATIAINDSAQVAMKLEVIGGSDSQGIWFGEDAAGAIVYMSPSEGVLGDPTLTNSGIMATNQFFTTPVAIVRIDGPAMTGGPFIFPGGVFGLISLGSPIVNETGVIGFRGQQGAGGQAFISDDAGSQARHVAEVGANPMSPYSFLFTPDMNDARQIAGKARRGPLNVVGESQPDEIRLWNADGSSVLIAEDADSMAMSPFARFDNGVSVNNAGWVAFNSTLVGGGRGVYLSNGTTTLEIARSGGATPDVADVDFFRPDVNNDNVVVFRGVALDGLRSIFVGDGTTLTRLVAEHDLLPMDLGMARIDQHDGSPVYGGAPSINNRGDVAFQCGLTPPDNNQVEWGSGAFVALAKAGAPADLDGDGIVGAADLALLLGAWGPCPVPPTCPGDLDGDGSVGAGDLAIMLGSWG